MTIAHIAGIVLPRWFHNGTAMHADRIQAHDNGLLYLESGARVHATAELLSTGPARTGDFWTCETDENGQPTGAEKLMAGAPFQNEATPIAHSLDIKQVSADPQPGYKADEPTSGNPDDPAAVTAKDEMEAARDPVAEGLEEKAEPKDEEGK